MADGKYLTELTYEVDVLHKAVETTLDNKARIVPQEDGTLCYFSPEDGYPGFYWLEGHPYPHDNREDYIGLERFITYMQKHAYEYDLYLLAAPVWRIVEDEDGDERAKFNALLGDLEINLDDSEMNMGDLEMDIDTTPNQKDGKVIDFKTRQVLAEMPQKMKTLAELKDEVLAGRHVCAPSGNGGTTYVFRERRSGSIVEACGNASGKFVVCADMRLVREDEPGYDPSDYENLLTNASGPARHPVWQLCVIPDALMKQILQEVNSQLDMHRKLTSVAYDVLEREEVIVKLATHIMDASLLTLTIGEARNGNQQVYRDISLSEILRLAPALHPYAGTIQQHECLEVEIDSIKYGVYPF